MIALCVDDEELLLRELERAVSASPDISSVFAFRTFTDATAWLSSNKPDIAFLDVKLRGHTGFEIAEKIKELYPDTPIIFCTGYREYAYDAFKLHVSGYLQKPILAKDVQNEINIAKKNHKAKALLTVNCFGNFEVLKDGIPLHFKRKRSKEVLAYLIDRRGATVSSKEICAVLWEDAGDTQKNLMHLYKIIADLKQTLSDVGADDVFIKNNYDYSVDTSKLDCDYYKYLLGDPIAEKMFNGEYMSQYSWAEETVGLFY